MLASVWIPDPVGGDGRTGDRGKCGAGALGAGGSAVPVILIDPRREMCTDGMDIMWKNQFLTLSCTQP